MATERLVLPFFAVKALDSSQRVIEGYASTADLDAGGDVVEPYAAKFADPADVQVFLGHDWRLGALPVGVPLEIRQDQRGLFTKTRIHATARGDELLQVAAERAAVGKPLGISIGYPEDSVKAAFQRKDGRTIRRIQSYVLREYSFTSSPMNEHAVVTAVKDRTRELSDEEMTREIEQTELEMIELEMILWQVRERSG